MTARQSQSKPRIAIAVTSVLVVRWFILPHIQRLARDYDVTVLLRNDFPEDLAEIDLPASVIEIPIARKISLLSDLRTLFTLIWIFHRQKFDVVHTITPKAGLLGIVAAFVSRVPVRIHTFQGELWAHRKGFMRWLLRTLDIVVARLATHLTVVSRTERGFLEENGVLPKGKAKVLGAGSIGGVDTRRFFPDETARRAKRSELGIPDDACVFIFVGRLCVDKGLPTLVAAMRDVLRTHADARLLVVGPDEEDMEAFLYRELDAVAGDRLQVFPFNRFPETLLAAADVLVLPSLREGFGVVIIEAAAMGLPAIGSDIYGIRDAISDGETGLLFATSDAADLASKMRTLIDDPVLRDKLGHAAQKRAVDDFAQEKIVDAFAAFYETLPIRRRG